MKLQLGGVALYLAVTVPFMLLPFTLSGIGLAFDAAMSITLVGVIVLGAASTWYIRSLYQASEPPRSVFWAMLVSALEVKIAFAGWIAYILTANLLAKVGIFLPLPAVELRAVITSLIAIGVLSSAVYYAVTIALVRRAGDIG